MIAPKAVATPAPENKSTTPEISPEFACPSLVDAHGLQPQQSPFAAGSLAGKWVAGLGQKFVQDEDCVLLNALRYEVLECSVPTVEPTDGMVDGTEEWAHDGVCEVGTDWKGRWAMRAGPREAVYFEPSKVKAAIVTCGGLCPGLNDVIRQLTITLEEYGVDDIKGIRYGFRGFFEQEGELRQPIKLTSDLVETIHLEGGSILGSSRGGSDTSDIVDAERRHQAADDHAGGVRRGRYQGHPVRLQGFLRAGR